MEKLEAPFKWGKILACSVNSIRNTLADFLSEAMRYNGRCISDTVSLEAVSMNIYKTL